MNAILPDDAFAGFVELTEADGLKLDIRYATANNFLGRKLYGAFDRFLLHPIAADKLRVAIGLLENRKPGSRFLVFDGLRPNRVQRLMWDAVRGTPQQPYVGDPAIGSIHGYGLAVDLSLLDGTGHEVDMGTPFDDFSERAEPRREAALLAGGALTAGQVEARRLLRAIMGKAGFHPIAIEWWHFDALPADEVRRTYHLVE